MWLNSEVQFLSYKLKKKNLLLAVLGNRCWAPAFSSRGQWGLLFVGVRGLLAAVASPAADHGL